MLLFVAPMYDKPQSESSLFKPACCKGMVLLIGLKNGLTFLYDLYIVLIKNLLQDVAYCISYSLHMRNMAGCCSTVSGLK